MLTNTTLPPEPESPTAETSWEDVGAKSLSQGQLMIRRFRRHKLAMGAIVVLVIFYTVALFAGFFATANPVQRNSAYIYAPPMIPRFIDSEGNFHLRPFVYGLESTVDPDTWDRIYKPDHDEIYPIRFFVETDEYNLLGPINASRRLVGIESENQPLFLFGTDSLGRDVFSRVIHGTRISLSIGLVGVFLSLVLGLLIGGVSGLLSGGVDLVIQRIIEILISIPQIPFWMALSASLPAHWSPIQTYFAITVLLSLLGWTQVARVVRGKFLSLREIDFVSASIAMGANDFWVIVKHLIPNFFSYVLVTITLTIPAMILGETALSFLGIGLRPPVVSWGVLLQQAQNMRTVAMRPWLLVPGIFVIIAVMAFNFVGDGLRDAADPYSSK